MIIKTIVFCVASSTSLAAYHEAVAQVQKYQAAERVLVSSFSPPTATAAGSFAQVPGQATAPDGLTQLRAALQ